MNIFPQKIDSIYFEDDCVVCRDSLSINPVLAHKFNGRYICLVHENCLLEARRVSKFFHCVTCHNKIDEDSMLSISNRVTILSVGCFINTFLTLFQTMLLFLAVVQRNLCYDIVHTKTVAKVYAFASVFLFTFGIQKSVLSGEFKFMGHSVPFAWILCWAVSSEISLMDMSPLYFALLGGAAGAVSSYLSENRGVWMERVVSNKKPALLNLSL